MIEITPIQVEHIAQAKRVIYTVAHNIFTPELTLEEFIEEPDSQHWLDDVDDYQEIYAGSHGLLLVALDDGKVIGTGGIHKLKVDVAELKRIWLLEPYHGQKIGFRVVSLLLDFARQNGYTSVYLETSAQQERAIAFYQKMGFRKIAGPHDEVDGVSMEMQLV